jgi:hypothetical protein
LVREEVLVPFPLTLTREPDATHVRGTLLIASRRALRRAGHFERYRAHLAPEHDIAIASSIAGTWLPIELGVAHYRACDALELSADEQHALGGAVVHDLQRTFIGSALRAAGNGLGISPLLGLRQFFSIYARAIQGGGGRMLRVGPKDVRAEFIGNPFASIRYFRIAYRGYIQAGCEFFAQHVVVAELPAKLTPTTMAYRIAWV